ncbi:MAG: GDSL-type esterase/lipase family protein, partial [Spirillospora sp.]
MRLFSLARPLTLVALAAVAALLVTLVASPPARPRTAVAAVRDRAPLRVMPLGDSITEGYDASTLGADGGYRTDLWQFFKADGRAVDLVGSASRGPARLGDRDHEGHGGWRVDHIAGGASTACGDMSSGANVTGWVTAARPDAVLLHIGTNDIFQNCAIGTDSATLAGRLSKLIDYITKAAPAADVHVATITPMADKAKNAQVNAYNARIPGIVKGKAGGRVHLVDVNAAVPVGDVSDGVHPTNGGYSKMAARWYGALTGALPARTEAEASTSTLNKASVVETVNASSGRKVGHIDEADSYVQLSVRVATAGPYRLYVRGANGTGASCTHRLTVNGGSARDVSYPSFGWDQWTIAPAEVWLGAGDNAVRLAKGDCHAEVDSVDAVAGLAMYPRAIRLAHAGASNGRIIASLNTSSTGGLTDMSRFYESTDGGATFQPVGEVRDGEAADGRGSCCGSLFELPAQAGSLPAGTLLWGTTVGMSGTPGRRPAIRVWQSPDRGRTWSYLSSCAVAGGPVRPSEGFWEPEFSVTAQGGLTCYFSDETRYPSSAEKSTQVISAVTSTDGGRTWGPRRVVVDLGAGERPGMPNVRRLPSGGYVMAYELCGSARPQACKVYQRTSADGTGWGDPAEPGTVARDLDGNAFFHAPTLAVAPSASPDGRLLLVGGLVKNPAGGILLGQSGRTILTSTEGGAGNWTPVQAPVQVPFSSTTPGGEEVVCNNYSSALL